MQKLQAKAGKKFRNIRLSIDTWRMLDSYADELAMLGRTRKISMDYAVKNLLSEHRLRD